MDNISLLESQFPAPQLTENKRKLIKQKRILLFVGLLVSIFTITFLVLTIVYAVKHRNVIRNTNIINQQIQELDTKINAQKINRTLDLSNSNINNISLQMTGHKTKVKKLILNNNSISAISYLHLPHLQTLLLNNNPITSLQQVTLQSIHQIQMDKELKTVQNSLFGFKQMSEQFKNTTFITNCTFPNLQSIIFNRSKIGQFDDNNLPYLTSIQFIETNAFVVSIKKAPKLMFLSINETIKKSQLTVRLQTQNPSEVYLKTSARLSLILTDSKELNFRKIEIPSVVSLGVSDSFVQFFDQIPFSELQRISLNNVSGFQKVQFNNLPKVSSFRSNNTDIKQINFFLQKEIQMVYLSIQKSDIEKFQFLNSSSAGRISLQNNDFLKEVVNNYLPSILSLVLCSSVVTISNNNFERLNSFNSNTTLDSWQMTFLVEFNNNVLENAKDLFLSNSSLKQIRNNNFRSVQTVHLENSRLNDTGLDDLLKTNIWTQQNVVYINLRNSDIVDKDRARKQINNKFPKAELQI